MKLGVNIDHVATLRQARGGLNPDPVKAALVCEAAGADNITCHLREDRRHIQDQDVYSIKERIKIPLNLEMAATDEMLKIALTVKPHTVTLVPERRQELTTEGGLDVNRKELRKYVDALLSSDIPEVSLFIDPTIESVEQSKMLGVHSVEFHTGKYSHAYPGASSYSELKNLTQAVSLATQLGMQAHAGHGLSFDNVADVVKIRMLSSLQIGHALISEAIYEGLHSVVSKMKALME